jgi:hypothetical protein
MADIAFVGPAEIGYGVSEFHQFFQNASPGDGGMGFSLYICSRTGGVAATGKTFLVKRVIVHNCLFFNPLSYE